MAMLLPWLLLLGLGSVQAQYFGNYYCPNGGDVVVHLFEWPWEDVKNECAKLASWGYCAVQVSPPQEHVTGSTWWTRYQPVSYIINSRGGTRAQFEDMVETCNNLGVWIYVDAVINHMTGGGAKTGWAGSPYDAGDGPYTESYPAVPYDGSYGDFNGNNECPTSNLEIQNYNDVVQVRNCRLLGLRDLQLGKAYIQETVRAYMNDLIGMGVAGFRVDACKHMWPGDLNVVYSGLNDLSTRWFPLGTKPYVYQEVIDQGGEPITAGEYTGMGRVTEFKYCTNLADCVRGTNGQRMAYLSNFGEGWNFMSGFDALVFVDNHDNQRGHGGGGNIITFHEPVLYKFANAFELAWNYGHVRIMSSYEYVSDTDAGPPSDRVTCFDGWWMCEHAWRQIYNMVGFHRAVMGQDVRNWWDNGNMQIAFSRGSRGFIAINREDSASLTQTLQTSMPSGQYCDVISSENNMPPCDGKTVTVNGDGTVNLNISPGEDAMIAIHM